MQSTQPRQFTLDDVVELLRRHPRRWMAPAVIILLLATAAAVWHKPRWEVIQPVMVRNDALQRNENLGEFRLDDELKSTQETVLEVAFSRSVLEGALQEVGPPAETSVIGFWPDSTAIKELRSALAITPPVGSDFGASEVFYLKMQDPDPDRAERLLHAVFEQLAIKLADLREQRTQSVLTELEFNAQLSEAALAEAVGALAVMERDAGEDLIELRMLHQAPSGNGDINRPLVETQNELRMAERAQVERRVLLSRLQQVATGADSLLAAPESLLAKQTTLKLLLEGLAAARLQTARVAGTFTKKAPLSMVAQQAEAAAQNAVRNEAVRVRETLQAEIDVEAARIEILQKQIAELQTRVTRLAEMRAPYSQQVSHVDHLRSLAESANESLALMQASHAASRASSVIIRSDPPDLGDAPLGPSRAMMILVGMFGGLFVGVACLVLTTRFPTDELNGASAAPYDLDPPRPPRHSPRAGATVRVRRLGPVKDDTLGFHEPEQDERTTSTSSGVSCMTIIVAICATTAAMWSAVYLLRGSLLLGVAGYVVVVACFGHPFWNLRLGPAPITVDRVLLLGLAAAFFVQRCFGRTDRGPLTVADGLFLALLGWLGLSTTTHDFMLTLEPPNHVAPLWRYAGGYVFPAIAYWIARRASLTRSAVIQSLVILTSLGIYLAITGVLETHQVWSLVFPRHIADPTVGIHFGRARGPMVTSVSYGLCLSVCTLALWTLARNQSKPWRASALYLFTPLCCAGLYFSYTRSVWLGFAAATFLTLVLALRGKARAAVVAVSLLASVVGAAASFDRVLNFERETSAAETRDSSTMRLSFTYLSYRMFLDRPLLGCGFGHFPRMKSPYLADRRVDLNLQALDELVHHNTFLSVLTETGAPGLLLYLAVLSSWVRAATRLRNSPAAPPWAQRFGEFTLATLMVYALQAMFHELSYGPLDNTVMCFAAGTTVGLYSTYVHPANGETQITPQTLLLAEEIG